MAAADYRLLTEATGQRIAAALEALSGTGAAAAAARANLDVYSKGETDAAIAQSTAVEDVDVGVSGVTAHKMGKLVQLTSAGATITASSAGWVDVFTIPTDIRPADANLYFSGVDNNASTYAASPAINMRINRSALKVQAYAYSDKLSFSPRFCVTYFTP